MTARYHETLVCPPGRCFEGESIGAIGCRCTGECLAKRVLAGRFVEDVPAVELFSEGDVTAPVEVELDDSGDIEPAPETWAQLTCPDWTP